MLNFDWLKQDRNGKLASGAIANLVDEVGGAVVHIEGLPMNVSVDMSISFLSTAKVNVSVKTPNPNTPFCNFGLLTYFSLKMSTIMNLCLESFYKLT